MDNESTDNESTNESTNFDQYLERKLQDAAFRRRFEAADRAWDIAIQLAELRRFRGLTQQEVAEQIGSKQQAIARLEDPSYSGHSLTMLRKYAEALGAIVDVTLIPVERARDYERRRQPKPLLAKDEKAG